MQAIILAGGFGTRLKSMVSDLPKPMANVSGKPFLTYILDQLDKNHFTKVVLAVGYKSEAIIDYYKNKYKSMDLVYSLEDHPLGTGGCVKKAMELIDEEYCYIINGDTYFDVDFEKMKIDSDVTMACKYLKDFDRYGTVKLDGDKIVGFLEKQKTKEGYINGGIYRIKKDLFDRFNFEERFSLEKDLFEKYVSNINIRALLSNGYFIDIGIPSDYLKAQEDFKNA